MDQYLILTFLRLAYSFLSWSFMLISVKRIIANHRPLGTLFPVILEATEFCSKEMEKIIHLVLVTKEADTDVAGSHSFLLHF